MRSAHSRPAALPDFRESTNSGGPHVPPVRSHPFAPPPLRCRDATRCPLHVDGRRAQPCQVARRRRVREPPAPRTDTSMPLSADRRLHDPQETRLILMTEPPRRSPLVSAIAGVRRTHGVRRQGWRVAGARRVNRILAAMAYSRRIEELLAEARYGNRHNLYRTTRKPPP